MSGYSSNTPHNEDVLGGLRNGDLVKFRGGTHWGVYLGDEDVIHLKGSGEKFTNNTVVKENFWKVADGCRAEKDNNNDDIRRPLPSHEIERQARALVGSQNNKWENGKEFAFSLRYGKESFDQRTRQSIYMSSLSQHRQHNLRVLEELHIGDIVEFERELFKHFGVYVGNEDVVHLTGVENGWFSGVQFIGKGMVKRENFWDVAKGGKAKKNNNQDGISKPRPSSLIVSEARALVGTVENMHFLTNNCEHFASKLRYGKKSSKQGTLGAVAIGSAALAFGGIPGLVLAGGLFLSSVMKNKNDK
ncbi:phospholipase A and acyltransferase 5-like [Argopecten irradians]|uniref:phospholipase A and acyltransferase 5-like n=1 Tax=Argopecten irradians TaxID=31199 RepID=UPI00372134D0